MSVRSRSVYSGVSYQPVLNFSRVLDLVRWGILRSVGWRGTTNCRRLPFWWTPVGSWVRKNGSIFPERIPQWNSFWVAFVKSCANLLACRASVDELSESTWAKWAAIAMLLRLSSSFLFRAPWSDSWRLKRKTTYFEMSSPWSSKEQNFLNVHFPKCFKPVFLSWINLWSVFLICKFVVSGVLLSGCDDLNSVYSRHFFLSGVFCVAGRSQSMRRWICIR